MKFRLLPVLLAAAILASVVKAQTPPPSPVARQKLSETLARNLAERSGAAVSAEERGRAYAKVLEGQRYLLRTNAAGAGAAAVARQARAAFQAALQVDPTIAEAYTALAEITLRIPPSDIDESVALASLAVKVDPNNFGARRLLARLYTYKSNLNSGRLEPAMAALAIEQWREVTRLDPRNAEGWAFLAELYAPTDLDSHIDALRKWVAAAAPIDTGFYRQVMGSGADLSPERASLKLGKALVRAGQAAEAVEVLSLLVADEPDNEDAIGELRDALTTADVRSASSAVEALRQAVYANPDSADLVTLFAHTQAKAGRVDEGVKVLQKAVSRAKTANPDTAPELQVSLGDLYVSAERYMEGAAAYEAALRLRGLDRPRVVQVSERGFALNVYEKLINCYRKANRPAEARAAIQRARTLLGQDAFAG
ncbi:MAG: tetratricopeptide repeat protein [Pyrinomonadaceae bacterium]